ncbi:hypothetical protein AVEN_140520-1 [Araneus ventricosus]|uniref:Reverse transcriptase domain-containing protein n=1 Tax=Araneus ventricosus TaxID=182803 RepID=A0A4Y2HA19_ARAVE|nr:hypothetical protein AVEN_140520-1 [Araneus ventricosus]
MITSLIDYSSCILIESSNNRSNKYSQGSDLKSWCQAWHMEIAPQKSSIINFSSRASPAGFPVPFCSTNIPWTSSVRFLDILFDDTISFRSHIDLIKRKTLRKLNVIKA